MIKYRYLILYSWCEGWPNSQTIHAGPSKWSSEGDFIGKKCKLIAGIWEEIAGITSVDLYEKLDPQGGFVLTGHYDKPADHD